MHESNDANELFKSDTSNMLKILTISFKEKDVNVAYEKKQQFKNSLSIVSNRSKVVENII